MGPKAPAVPSLRVSEFYERKRRLAYVFAVLSMVFLAAELALGSLLELSSHPRASVSGDTLLVLQRCLTRDNPEGSRLLSLDPAMKLRREPLSLVDAAGAVLPEGDAITLFYGNRASFMTGGKLVRSVDLKQKWDVLAAVPDPDGPWIFGWNDGKIVARRRRNDAWGPEIEVAASGAVDRLSASRSLVAWRERGKTVVRTATFENAAFAPRAEFEIGPLAQHWDAVLAGNRILFAHYNRDDRAFQTLTLRFACCPGCPSPVAATRMVFVDPVLHVSRRVTGLALAVTGDRLRFFVTRPVSIMTASAPLETLRPEPGSRLVEISVDPLWRSIAGAITPMLLVFFSCSLVFLGITLLRERARLAGGGGEASPRSRFVGILPRAMAYVLDFILLFPVCIAVSKLMAVSIEDVEDPHYLLMLGIWGAIEIAYRFGMEWALGWTLGKRIIGLRVAEIDGSRVTFRGALVRNLTRIIDSQVPFGVLLGLFLMIKTERRQRLGDLFGRTVVVQDLN